MFSKTYFILINMLISALNAERSNDFGTDCLIHNDQYEFEYLYSPNENTKSVDLINLKKVNDYNKLRWSLIETRNQSGQYYLKSSYFGDYLCALLNFGDIFQMRRRVARFKIDTNMSLFNNCKWTIKQHNSNLPSNIYSIVNVLFDEPLYASKYLFQKEIYLWHRKKNADSKKFKWIIYCQSGHHIWI